MVCHRINRYIMECKSEKLSISAIMVAELIDTLWNVNSFIFINPLGSFPELIDTLWNVNKQMLIKRQKSQRELIDTLWNVNALAQHFEESENSN